MYHLDTNASYWFRVWANNALGSGPPVEVLATTLFTDQEAGQFLTPAITTLAPPIHQTKKLRGTYIFLYLLLVIS